MTTLLASRLTAPVAVATFLTRGAAFIARGEETRSAFGRATTCDNIQKRGPCRGDRSMRAGCKKRHQLQFKTPRTRSTRHKTAPPAPSMNIFHREVVTCHCAAPIDSPI